MPNIAPSAHVAPQAVLAPNVEVGPGCYVGPLVVIGEGCRLLPNVTMLGRTDIGPDNIFHPGCVIGGSPQDLKYQGSDTRLVIGSGNVFREHVTVHTGTELGGGITHIGNQNQFQIGSHIAHDVQVGHHCVLSNSVQIAGHVHIEDYVNISGLVGVQQFVTLGRYAFIAGATRCTFDVPPYTIFAGFDGTVVAVNDEGLRRWGFDADQIERIWALYRQIFSKKAERSGKTITDRLAVAESDGPLGEHERYLLEFLKRSLHNGVFGRHLESRRREITRPPSFYTQGA
jgi:UDP-N-acetylglucosamine acyltransferase